MPADTTSRNRDLVTRYLAAATDLLAARAELKVLREAVTAHGPGDVLTPEAFAGTNAQLAPEDFGPFLAAMDALEALLVDPATGEPTAHLKAIMKFRR